MRFPIYQTRKSSNRLGRTFSAALFVLSIFLVIPSLSTASGFNVTSPQAPPYVGQPPVTDSGVRANWLGYYASPMVWTGRRGVDRQEQNQMRTIIPGWGR